MYKYKRPALLYTSDGIVKSKVSPEEIEWLIAKLPDIKGDVEQFLREHNQYRNSYNRKKNGNHNACYSSRDSNQAEKMIARGLINWQDARPKMDSLYRRLKKDVGYVKVVKSIGRIKDYEIPLLLYKNGRASNRRIDLVSVSSDKKKVYILELKRVGSAESILRCLLEAFTYSMFINRKKFREEFEVEPFAKIVVCPLIFEGSTPYNQLVENKTNPQFNELLRKMESIGDVEVAFAILRATEWSDPASGFPEDANKKCFNPEWLK